MQEKMIVWVLLNTSISFSLPCTRRVERSCRKILRNTSSTRPMIYFIVDCVRICMNFHVDDPDPNTVFTAFATISYVEVSVHTSLILIRNSPRVFIWAGPYRTLQSLDFYRACRSQKDPHAHPILYHFDAARIQPYRFHGPIPLSRTSRAGKRFPPPSYLPSDNQTFLRCSHRAQEHRPPPWPSSLVFDA